MTGTGWHTNWQPNMDDYFSSDSDDGFFIVDPVDDDYNNRVSCVFRTPEYDVVVEMKPEYDGYTTAIVGADGSQGPRLFTKTQAQAIDGILSMDVEELAKTVGTVAIIYGIGGSYHIDATQCSHPDIHQPTYKVYPDDFGFGLPGDPEKRKKEIQKIRANVAKKTKYFPDVKSAIEYARDVTQKEIDDETA